MPRIHLKPNSPEFAEDNQKSTATKTCDMPRCNEKADHKAPKDRGLNEYYHFCLDHIREYNRAWNFFDGMSDDEVHEHMMKSVFGDRPTWKYGVDAKSNPHFYAKMDQKIRDKIWQDYGEEKDEQQSHYRYQSQEHQNTPEFEAMAVMGLEPPVDLIIIKKRYKELAKKYHPDLNKGCAESEDMLKKINMAYTILKLAYDKFDELPERQ